MALRWGAISTGCAQVPSRATLTCPPPLAHPAVACADSPSSRLPGARAHAKTPARPATPPTGREDPCASWCPGHVPLGRGRGGARVRAVHTGRDGARPCMGRLRRSNGTARGIPPRDVRVARLGAGGRRTACLGGGFGCTAPATLRWRDAATAREHVSRTLTPDGRPYDLFAEVLDVLAEGGMDVTLAWGKRGPGPQPGPGRRPPVRRSTWRGRAGAGLSRPRRARFACDPMRGPR